jgi:glycosyltransferase involved in cell wall biosynthesis
LNILFVHQNFPAQFVHIAPALAARGHKVLALTASTNKRKFGVSAAHYPWDNREFDPKVFELSTTHAQMMHRAGVVARSGLAITQKTGFKPDVILSHLGWGEPILLKEVWPDAHLKLYAEFFYRPKGLDTDFDPEFGKSGFEARARIVSRQPYLLQSYYTADSMLAPTQWQASFLPEFARAKTTVIHDGIDTAVIGPGHGGTTVTLPGTTRSFRQGDELLTFVNRNLEPYRGYHIFMRALAKVLRERPAAQVVIIGDEAKGYGAGPPPGTTWKQKFLDEVGDRLDLSRVHFVGHVPHAVLTDLMRVTRVHAYLTYPFVLSWSMLEAMAAEALVVGSRTPPVTEFIEDGVNGRLVDFFDVDGWSNTLIDCLARPDAFTGMRRTARQTVIARCDLKTRCLPDMIANVEAAASRPLDKLGTFA